MKAIILLLVVVCVGCASTTQNKNLLIADPFVEKAIRVSLGGRSEPYKGKLTKGDLEKITQLNLRGRVEQARARITDAGLKELVKLKQLKHLQLDKTDITDAGLKEVAKLQKLTFLDLRYNRITDAGLQELAKLKQLETLTLLGAAWWKPLYTKAGVAQLQKTLPKCKIYSNPTK